MATAHIRSWLVPPSSSSSSSSGVRLAGSSQLKLRPGSSSSTLYGSIRNSPSGGSRLSPMPPQRATVCIGDLHGYSVRLRALWRNLELHLGPSAFSSATVIFLGDYCDRGPDTAGVLDFLLSLGSRYPQQDHVFLAGNHDFGFAAFLGLISDTPDGFDMSSTWKALSKHREEQEGWWTGPGVQGLHLQARRWAGRMTTKFNAKKGIDYRGSIYDSEPTFNSYGVNHGDRQGLLQAVPDGHKEFLQSLLWIYEQEGAEVTEDPSLSYSRLVAVHAGLEEGHIQEQLAVLRNKDATLPRVEALCGRDNVWDTPKELVDAGVLLVSGHHGRLHMDKHRLVIDESGGMEHLPVAAVVLPARTIVRDTDVLVGSTKPQPEKERDPLPA